MSHSSRASSFSWLNAAGVRSACWTTRVWTIGCLWSMSAFFVLVLVFALFVAVRPLRDRFALSLPNRWNLGRAVLLIPPTMLMLILGVLYVGSRSAYLQGQQLAVIQIRYLPPALLGQVLLAAVALHVMARRLDRWLAPVLLTGTVVFLALSANEVLDLEMSSSNASYQIRMGDASRFVVGWAPFPTALTVCLLILTVVVILVGLVAFWAAALSQPRRSYRPEWEQIHALRPSAPGVAGVAGVLKRYSSPPTGHCGHHRSGPSGRHRLAPRWPRPRGPALRGCQLEASRESEGGKDTGRLRHDEARTATETAVATKRQLRSENSPSEPASLSASQSTTPRPSRSSRQLHRWARRPCDLSHRCGIISGVTSWVLRLPRPW